jgi:predicted nucleotidyltransferase component of viral defense system
MVAPAFVRQFAVSQGIGLEVADQEIVLHYALALLNEGGLIGSADASGKTGPLLFKGGTALRKCVFGSTGRFSQDIDVDAAESNGFENKVEDLFSGSYHGTRFSLEGIRYSKDENFSGTVGYRHDNGAGTFELQISYRLDPILESANLELQAQPYFKHVEPALPILHGLDPYEMIGEKIMACNRRVGGSAKDVYDLYLWTGRPFDADLVRLVSALKAWTDQRRQPLYDPETLLGNIVPSKFRWTDIANLVPRRLGSDPEEICERVRARFAFLAEVPPKQRALIDDQVAHREHRLFNELRTEARRLASQLHAR